MHIPMHDDVGDLLISSAFQKLLLKISNFVTNIMYANNAQLGNVIVKLLTKMLKQILNIWMLGL